MLRIELASFSLFEILLFKEALQTAKLGDRLCSNFKIGYLLINLTIRVSLAYKGPRSTGSTASIICEQCAKEMAEHNPKDPLLYTFKACPFCSSNGKLSIRINPVTASNRVLSIDGGGVRAVIPIQFLRALQHALGLSMPVQEHFEYCYGTSSGRIIRKFLNWSLT